MKAFLIDHYKKGSALRLGQSPEPQLRENDVMVEIHAASVNPLDAKIRDGEFKLILPYRLPLVLGNDVAGIVVRVGANVRQFKPGDAVYARPDQDRIGTFAEYIAIDAADVALKPANLSMEEAASIPLVALTAWQALVERAKLQKGQRVLIHAGSGGVGTIAIQLAKHLGAHVATTVSTANIDLVKSLGADVVVDYRKDDFEKVLKGYDVVLNSLGKDTLEKSLAVLKPGGKLISISGPPDPDFARENGFGWLLQQVMRFLSLGIRRKSKRRGIGYSFLFMTANGAQLGKITALIEAGAIRPVIDRAFPFEKTNEALDYVETGRVKGKVVITVK
ncbi:NADP-dependent oxidoreductase [Rhizobium leguminosarum]|uniref:NADP-dependent oxidoreductase n=1 Tax=Rhizobium leguminosarum TaxID=384 RepID=UPI001031556A|nr:NADP-dependent oxidoreductase [Rhizobium leguminosarum]TAU74205.1 NADP-dependent oxidoreductase [Rhizobium leguminosarum]TAV83695.1 NADP-dependent oxidoreductase [Rhizobium leguminosarum]TAV84272.1 NADP-dependent oxidoreductase [Rhizobium leguminosarum]TAW26707.1 NADP-dependent oxidoreductase [Rhizobium leguminosarum]TAX04377.1 NADP-dependent oxidoreductase [Rhizobium leguminosarum]